MAKEVYILEICKECGSFMQSRNDDDEPMIIHWCTNEECGNVEYERLNGYEG